MGKQENSLRLKINQLKKLKQTLANQDFLIKNLLSSYQDMVSAFKILQAQQRSSAEIAGSYQQQLEQISFTSLQLQATLEVNNIERQVLGGQVQGLHALIPIVENYKHLEDSKTFREEIMLNKLTECELDKSRLEGEIHNCLTDRNEIMSSFNVYKHQTTKQLEEKQLALNTFKQEMKGYIDEAQGKKTELEATLALLQKATAENQDLRAEMDKLRQRISMLRQNRNWNIIQSQLQDQVEVLQELQARVPRARELQLVLQSAQKLMGWRHLVVLRKNDEGCTRQVQIFYKIMQIGCKYQKHFCKEDEEEIDELRKQDVNFKKIICTVILFFLKSKLQCCKMHGHTEHDCPKDPNIKTGCKDINEDFERVHQKQIFHRLMERQEAKIFGTNLMAIFNKYISDLLQKLTQKQFKPREIVSEQGQQDEDEEIFDHPFNKGILCFDDFNYSTFFQSKTKSQLKALLDKQFLREVAYGYKFMEERHDSIINKIPKELRHHPDDINADKIERNSTTSLKNSSSSLSSLSDFQNSARNLFSLLQGGLNGKDQNLLTPVFQNDKFGDIVRLRTEARQSSDKNMIDLQQAHERILNDRNGWQLRGMRKNQQDRFKIIQRITFCPFYLSLYLQHLLRPTLALSFTQLSYFWKMLAIKCICLISKSSSSSSLSVKFDFPAILSLFSAFPSFFIKPESVPIDSMHIYISRKVSNSLKIQQLINFRFSDTSPLPLSLLFFILSLLILSLIVSQIVQYHAY